MMHAEAIAHLTLAAHGLRVEAAVEARAAARNPGRWPQHMKRAAGYEERAAQIDTTIQQLQASESQAAA